MTKFLLAIALLLPVSVQAQGLILESAAEAPAFQFATTRVAATTGSQAITTGDMAGTPEAALTIVTGATADGTPSDGARFAVGACTAATERWAYAVAVEHGVTTSNTASWGAADECILLTDDAAAGVDGEADLSAFGAGGATFAWGNDMPASELVTVAYFDGLDDAWAGVVDPHDTVGNTVNVTSPGFQANFAVVVTSFRSFFDDAGNVHASMAFGMWDGTAMAHVMASDRDGVTTTTPVAFVSGTAVGSATNNAHSDIDPIFTLSANANGVDVNTTDENADPAIRIGLLLLDLPTGTGAAVGTFATPTATGNITVSGLSFQPSSLILACSLPATVETETHDATDAATLMISFVDADEAYANSWSTHDNVTTTDSESFTDDTALNLHLDDGSAGVICSLSSFTSDGFVLSCPVTVDAASAHQCIYGAFE